MKTLYLDCGMGAAGDMLGAALYELLDDAAKKEFINQMNSLGIPKIKVAAESSSKCGIVGTRMTVMIDGEEECGCDHEHIHNHAHEHTHSHEHEHDGVCHSHEHSHNHAHEHTHSHEHEHDGVCHSHEHSHNHAHEHTHSHEHEHDGVCHSHEHSHNHAHEHTHAHEHGHGEHHHSHTSMAEVEHIIDGMNVSDKVKADVKAVYKLIAAAESKSHGMPVSEIHFHEVGMLDAIADVTAVCLLIEKLSVEKIISSSIHVGSGHVHCMHGIVPVPAPATAYILSGVPMYGGKIEGELCTPTGAALLKHFVSEFGDMPVIKTEKIGYGMGKKDFEITNCVRAMLGELDGAGDEIIELYCNIDDISSDRIGYATDKLFEAGALDVYTVAINMKKSRPAVMLCVMCKEDKKNNIVHAIFKHTSTIGIRENISRRYILDRKTETLKTGLGDVRVKYSEGYGVSREKYEYDDLAKIASEKNLSIDEVINIISNEGR